MRLRVDLNADLGEGAAAETELLRHVTSASVSCGLHAGDPASLARTLSAARDAGVAVGAHPSLADRENFGRLERPVTRGETGDLIAYQLAALGALAARAGLRLRHVKPHGALYTMGARDASLADAIAREVVGFDPDLILFAPAGSELAAAGRANGLRVAREIFADRNYRADGSLVPRSHPDAMLHNASAAADRVMRILREGTVPAIDGSEVRVEADTICLHGDSPDALAFASALRGRLADAHVTLAPPFAE